MHTQHFSEDTRQSHATSTISCPTTFHPLFPPPLYMLCHHACMHACLRVVQKSVDGTVLDCIVLHVQSAGWLSGGQTPIGIEVRTGDPTKRGKLCRCDGSHVWGPSEDSPPHTSVAWAWIGPGVAVDTSPADVDSGGGMVTTPSSSPTAGTGNMSLGTASSSGEVGTSMGCVRDT